MSTHSIVASSPMFSSIRSAKRCRCSARIFGVSAAHAGNASTAAVTAASAVRASPRATSASFQSQSRGDLTSKVDALGTRAPPM